MRTVAVFTDTYLPTVNGVSYTVRTWRDRWLQRGGRMPIVYPNTDERSADDDEYPVSSAPFPFYSGFRIAGPEVPDAVRDASPDLVHAHTPFTLGLAGRRLASKLNVPFVVSYHTPAGEYAGYLSDTFSDLIRRVANRYERWYFESADAVIVPSETAASAVEVGDTPVYVISNGVDTARFRPANESAVDDFRDRYSIPDGPLVGYTGRHGYEKRLGDIIAATGELDVSVVVAGDGPARTELRRQASERQNVVFPGFLDRDELAAFYTALDTFVFPSPVETQGLVALESIACGTPVVAADRGALTETVTDGETGTHFRCGDVDDLRAAISRVLADSDLLPTRFRERRRQLCVEGSIDELEAVYEAVLD